MSIPRQIFTCWFGDEPSDLIKKCINSQKIPGYRHHLITLDNVMTDSRYINEVRNAENLGIKRWSKMSDLVRIYSLFREGGIYLDADIEILPGKNFDDLLMNRMFIGIDENGYYANNVIGAEAGHPFLDFIIHQVEDNFRGSGGWVWEPGMEFFHNSISALLPRLKAEQNIHIVPSEYFTPYHWKDKSLHITEKTLAFHHYCGSWVN